MHMQSVSDVAQQNRIDGMQHEDMNGSQMGNTKNQEDSKAEVQIVIWEDSHIAVRERKEKM